MFGSPPLERVSPLLALLVVYSGLLIVWVATTKIWLDMQNNIPDLVHRPKRRLKWTWQRLLDHDHYLNLHRKKHSEMFLTAGDTLSSGGEYSGICPGLLEAGPISPASRFRYNPLDLAELCDRIRCLIRTCIPILRIFTGNYFPLMKVVQRDPSGTLLMFMAEVIFCQLCLS
jgi:hypothetical protein